MRLPRVPAVAAHGDEAGGALGGRLAAVVVGEVAAGAPRQRGEGEGVAEGDVPARKRVDPTLEGEEEGLCKFVSEHLSSCGHNDWPNGCPLWREEGAT